MFRGKSDVEKVRGEKAKVKRVVCLQSIHGQEMPDRVRHDCSKILILRQLSDANLFTFHFCLFTSKPSLKLSVRYQFFSERFPYPAAPLRRKDRGQNPAR